MGPKADVERAARVVFSVGDIEVVGVRTGGRVKEYETTCRVAGQVVARTSHRDWRKSYRMLRTQVEMLFDVQT